MGWFDEQIRQREALDDQLFEDSLIRVAGIVLGERTAERISDDRIITRQAIDEVLKYYHFRAPDIPESVREHEAQLDYCLRPHGIMKRRILLDEGWFRNSFGAILAYKEDGTPTALLPDKFSGYYYLENGKKVRLSQKTDSLFQREAYCFYKPLPQKKIGIPDLLLYMKSCLTLSDAVMAGLLTLAVTCVGMLMPRITKALTGPVIASGRSDMLLAITIFILCMMCSWVHSALCRAWRSQSEGSIRCWKWLSLSCKPNRRYLKTRRSSPGFRAVSS